MKRLISAVLLFVLSFNVRADEGMWLPVLLEQLNITDMKARGFMLNAEDIYSVNKTSMKDAVCLFGGGCTAELISNRGLLLTNHHCGFGAIQYHSSVQHDYLTDGFWAMNQKEELHTPGVTATFILSMRDVTNEVLADVTSTMDEAKRNEAIGKAIKNLEKKYSTTDAQAMIRAFYYGNVFYLFMTETFTDLRMVGAPPMSIGNFGGDTDNWVWPRHTADFSLFRIYAGKDNKPAAYSEENIPWTPRNFFTLNCKGIQPGDFTMVYGFPGRTTEYLTSWGVELVANVSDPLKVNLRTTRINLMVEEMNKSAEVRIKYAAKRNGVANAWKKWQGEMKGIKDNDVIRKKQLQEAEFAARVQRNQEWQNKYGNLLTDLTAAHQAVTPWQITVDYMNEACFSVEMIKFASGWRRLVELSTAPQIDQPAIDKQVQGLKGYVSGFFKDYDETTDRKIAVALLGEAYTGMTGQRPATFDVIKNKHKGNVQKYVDQLYNKTMFTSRAKLDAFLNSYKPADHKKLLADPMYKVGDEMSLFMQNVAVKEYNVKNGEINRLQRLYMEAQMVVFPEKKFYPDANSTLRVAYGQVKPYEPKDGVTYNWYTTLDGVMEKEDPNIPDYKVSPKLKELHAKKDYGRYADSKTGKLHTCFIASNHTTGGNSGSPVIDANGNLIGTNFDRCWEGTMSDINYDPNVCRNITLDIRYTLFIIDKYAGAGYLMDEMKIIW
jgi:hypothetical protein